MELSRLEGFYWVGRSGGYAAAARAMPQAISQPAIYQQVKRLEDELGLSLFERFGRADIRLSPAGRTLFDFVEPFFVNFPAALRAAHAQAGKGSLRIQAAPQVAGELLPGWLAQLRSHRKDVHVQLLERAFVDFESLRRGEVDLIVDHVRPQLPPGFASEVIAVNYGMLVAPSEHLSHALTRENMVEQLSALPFVAYAEHLPHRQLQRQALDEFALEPAALVEVERAESILAMVRAGLGYSFVSTMNPDAFETADLATLRFELDAARFPVVALWRNEGPINPLVAEFVRLRPQALRVA